MELLWLVLFVSFVVLEAATTQFICIWFAGGALISMICAMLGLSTTLQTTIFVFSSALLLVFTKKFVDKLKSNEKTKTNIDSLIGETAVVIEKISNIDSTGSVKLRGIEWSARSADGSSIEKNIHVTVKKIDGVKLIVDKIELQEGNL